MRTSGDGELIDSLSPPSTMISLALDIFLSFSLYQYQQNAEQNL